MSEPVPYKAYMRSPIWGQVRDAALKRADYRCQVCNSPDKLDVHHRSYENLGHEPDKDLIVMCAKCHALFHRKPPRVTREEKKAQARAIIRQERLRIAGMTEWGKRDS